MQLQLDIDGIAESEPRPLTKKPHELYQIVRQGNFTLDQLFPKGTNLDLVPDWIHWFWEES